jgi:hypothetical protein
MQKILSLFLVAVMAASTLLAASGSALARDNHRDRDRNNYGNRQQYVTSYCAEHPRSRDCREYRRNGGRWDDNNYRGFYERNHRDNNDAAIAALFGIVLGAAVVAGSHSNSNSGYDQNHVRRCAAKYRSYDSRSDSFLAYDGRRYRCQL